VSGDEEFEFKKPETNVLSKKEVDNFKKSRMESVGG